MDLQEKVREVLPEEAAKDLWESIYEAFCNEGQEGIKRVIDQQKSKIEQDFKQIEAEIRREIGGKK